MKHILFLALMICILFSVKAQKTGAESGHYLDPVKAELNKKYPDNRTINIVFHGHSVPSGYWATPEVHTLESYPQLMLKKIKEKYPYAVVNVITTSIGGEQSEQGQLRFASDVLTLKPDVLFIDYALNDRMIGLERAQAAWKKMIDTALDHHIKVILITPTPDESENLLDSSGKLYLQARQIRELANEYHIGLADPFSIFQEIQKKEGNVHAYMAQSNHPNGKGHEIVAEEIFKFF